MHDMNLNLSLELPAAAQEWVNYVLVWIGFGTLAGLLAKAIMPGRDPGGPLTTLLMGIVGTFIGCGTLMLILQGQRISPISVVGFAVGTAGAFVLLLFHRLLAGRLIVEGGHGRHSHHPHHARGRSRQRHTTIINND
jgi:uncharacterized membrane protein YeaQ/YmgE (transglycosylase-associated protein family)